MKYQITEQENYTLIEILESQLSESHHSHFKKLFTEIQSKKINHVITTKNNHNINQKIDIIIFYL